MAAVGEGGTDPGLEADSDVEFICSAPPPGPPPPFIIPPDLMAELAAAAGRIEREVCARLDARGERWRAEGGEGPGGGGRDGSRSLGGAGEEKKDGGWEEDKKMPSRETAAREREERRERDEARAAAVAASTFRYQEVASRCPGRLDVRHRMSQPPFNDPRVIANPLILPVIRDILGGEGGGAELVYAGLIFSFPGSTDQPWHMDGASLFPEERAALDLPPYALNVFLPLEDVTDELGPTEFLPQTHCAEEAEVVNESMMEWTMIESKWEELSRSRSTADIRKEIAADEQQWMCQNFGMIAPLVRQGDALIYDYRICHRGTTNLSLTKTRTMLYLMYARPWFKEHLNFGTEHLFDPKPDGDKAGQEQETEGCM